MVKRVRYTQEQKKNMKNQALEMLSQGKSQKLIADTLGITVTTLRALIQGESYPGQRSRKTTVASAPKMDTASPVYQLALKRDRLAQIAQEQKVLEEEANHLREELKSLYDSLGQELFG